MELNITFTELALLVWSGIATAAAFKYKHEAHVAKSILLTFITNEDARNQVVEAHKKITDFMKAHDV